MLNPITYIYMNYIYIIYVYVYIYIRAHFMQFIDGIGPNLTVLMGVYT